MERFSKTRIVAPLILAAGLAGGACNCENQDQEPLTSGAEPVAASQDQQRPSEYAALEEQRAAAVVADVQKKQAEEATAVKRALEVSNEGGPRCIVGEPGGMCELESGRHFTLEL